MTIPEILPYMSARATAVLQAMLELSRNNSAQFDAIFGSFVRQGLNGEPVVATEAEGVTSLNLPADSTVGLASADNAAFRAAAHGALVDNDIITSPAADATEVSVTPTVVTAQPEMTANVSGGFVHLDYTHDGTQVQIRNAATGEVVRDLEGVGLSVEFAAVPEEWAGLEYLTEYEVRARHKHDAGYWLAWSPWQAFTTEDEPE